MTGSAEVKFLCSIPKRQTNETSQKQFGNRAHVRLLTTKEHYNSLCSCYALSDAMSALMHYLISQWPVR